MTDSLQKYLAELLGTFTLVFIGTVGILAYTGEVGAKNVTEGSGVLVDPLDVDAIARGLSAAAALPCPNPAARATAESHDVRRQAERIEKILARAVGQPAG